MKRIKTSLGCGAFALVLLVSGCGQKGPLYLPKEPQQVPKPNLTAAPNTSLPQ